MLVIAKSFSCDVHLLLSLSNLLKIRRVLVGFWRSLRFRDLSWWRHKPYLFSCVLFLFIPRVNILLRMPILTLNWSFIANLLLRSLILLEFKVVLRFPVLHLSMSNQFLYLWFLVFRLESTHTKRFACPIWRIVNTGKW